MGLCLINQGIVNEKFFASLFKKEKSKNIQFVDPKKILFSVPTLSDDIAELMPLNEKPNSKDFGFNEDEWCQIEFFPKNQLEIIQQTLREYKRFEQEHRVNEGWNDVYIRKIQRIPVLSDIHPTEKLEKLLGVKVSAAPFLFTSSAISGKVKNGFTIHLGGNIVIYGYVDKENIPVLGANVGENPDDSRLTNAFMKLNASAGLLLVDWRSQLLVIDTNNASNVKIWRP